MNHLISPCARRFAALLLLLAPLTAPAQTPAVQLTPAAATPTVPAGSPAPAAPAPASAEKPEKEAKPKDLASALPTMKFKRTPEALLAATLAQRKGGEPTPADAFMLSVLYGDWGAVGKALAGLPPEPAAAGYARLLDSLAELPVSMGEVLKESEKDEDMDMRERMMAMNEERRESRGKSIPLLSEDVYALLAASPGDLREENIPALAKLAKAAVGEGGRATLLTRLQTGIKGLGGETPEGRKLATRLLSELGWIADAEPFLPLKKEEWEGADATQLVFAMEYFTQKGIAGRDERLLAQAAELCAWLMKTARFGNYTRPHFRLAMDRLVRLLPALEPEAARQLIREQLFKQTATLSDLIGVIGELGQAAAKQDDLAARAAHLGTQHLLLQALVAKEGGLPANTAVLVMNWLGEAEVCYRAGGVVATDMTQAERMMLRRFGHNQRREEATLSTHQILDHAPPAEIVARLNPGLAQRVRLTALKVGILRPGVADLTPLREYVKAYPGLEREVCQDVLAGWISKRSKPAESDEVKQYRAMGMFIPPQMLQVGAGIPLTRLRQNQNIRQLRELLADLRAISPEPLDPALIVQSFMTLHSGAEVYRMEDIEAIFGPPEKMVRAELLNLLDGMRGRLGEQWRKPETQQQAGTNRTEQEAKDEVSRGYRTAMEIVKRGIRPEDADWESFITRGQLFFDASQFEFERKVKLTEYVSLRDEAFGSFRTAASVYAAKLPDMPRGQWTVGPFQAWFFVMLGASDLAQLTSNAARADPGLTSIGDAMRALPGGAGEKHLEMFAKMLGEIFPRVPPHIRQRFLQSGLKIVGEDNPAAGAAAASLKYYQELLDELQLRVTVDGPVRVGHTQPFGVFIGLETTRQLLRESGGFAKYVQNNQSSNPWFAMMGRQQGAEPKHREEFTKNLHAALDETFEVVSVTFHDADVKTVDLPREGWVETPLAYVVLRAKNAAVDRIPSVQLDMDFSDEPGRVVLPVLSQVHPVDARDAAVAPRPVPACQISLLLDEREWSEGRLVLEIQARGEGVLPRLDDLFDTARAGFDLETVDGSLSIAEFVSDGQRRFPRADRNWQLTYRRKADLRGDVSFAFPALKPGLTTATLEYKHYQDADLVTIEPAVATAGIALPGLARNGLRNAVLLGIAGLAGFAVVVALRRRKPVAVVAGDFADAPSDPTPFTAVAYLRRLAATHAARLGESRTADLTSDITRIESTCFRPNPETLPDLQSMVQKWAREAGG